MSNVFVPLRREKAKLVAPRDGFGEGMVLAAKKNPRIIALCADVTESTRLHTFRAKFPDRFIEMGVAEQNMAGVAAGLALAGLSPCMVAYAVFSPGRNWDQIRVSICYNNANVKIAGAHAGLTVGPDGATHQALEDIAIMRVLPNMTVLCPADAIQTKKAVTAAFERKGPVYIRFGREPMPVIIDPRSRYTIGKADVLIPGDDAVIIACGSMVYESILASRLLRKTGIHAAVINNHTVKPLDRTSIIRTARNTGAVVTAEEHQIQGGMGSAISEALSAECPVPIEQIGVDNTFGESGTAGELLTKYGLTSDHIVKAVLRVIKRKKHAHTL